MNSGVPRQVMASAVIGLPMAPAFLSSVIRVDSPRSPLMDKFKPLLLSLPPMYVCMYIGGVF